MYIYTHTNTHTHTSIYLYLYIYINISISICIHTHTHYIGWSNYKSKLCAYTAFSRPFPGLRPSIICLEFFSYKFFLHSIFPPFSCIAAVSWQVVYSGVFQDLQGGGGGLGGFFSVHFCFSLCRLNARSCFLFFFCLFLFFSSVPIKCMELDTEGVEHLGQFFLTNLKF